MKRIFKVADAIALFVMATGALQAKPATPAATVLSVSLAIKTERKQVVSGSMIPVRAIFFNKEKLPFCFVQSYPAKYTFLFRAKFGAGHLRVPHTRFGRKYRVSFPFLPSHWIPPTQVVTPGKRFEYRSQSGRWMFMGRFLDMTMPGEYRVHLLTKHGVGKFGPAPVHTTSGMGKIGPHFFLIQDGFFFLRRVPIGGKNINSNWLPVDVAAPYRKLPAQALIKSARPVSIPPGKAGSNVHLTLTHPEMGCLGPTCTSVEVFDLGKRMRTVHLTGNPFVDFGRIEITGPSLPNEYIRANRPGAKMVPFVDKSPVPLTAYGKWLAKHPAKENLKWKTYTLKPGVTYEYAEPINLSCRFDMSLSGVYRVRVRLAHTHVFSPWAKIIVP